MFAVSLHSLSTAIDTHTHSSHSSVCLYSSFVCIRTKVYINELRKLYVFCYIEFCTWYRWVSVLRFMRVNHRKYGFRVFYVYVCASTERERVFAFLYI